LSSGGPDSDINANADSQPCSVGTMHNICLTESTLTSGCTYNRQRIHTAYRCRFQQHKTPQYVTDCVTPASDIASIDSDYALPVVTNFLCRVTNSDHLVVGPLLSLDPRLGIRCRLTSAIRRVVTSLSDVH